METKTDKLIKLRGFIDLCKKSPDALECILEFESMKGKKIVDLEIDEIEEIAASCNRCILDPSAPCPQSQVQAAG